MSFEDIKNWNSQFDETGFRTTDHYEKVNDSESSYSQAIDQCAAIKNKCAFREVAPLKVDEERFIGYKAKE